MEPPSKRACIDHGPASVLSVAATRATLAPGDDTASASNSSATQITAAATALIAPPHSRLHRHALESIFAFLSFREIRSVLFASREWLAAVYSMRGVGHLLPCAHSAPGGLRAVLASPLSRHVHSLHCSADIPLLLSPDLMRRVREAMPYLRSLGCSPLPGCEWPGHPRTPLPLPSELTMLHLTFDRGMDEVSANEFIRGLAHHTQLTDLRASMESDDEGEVSERSRKLAARLNFAPLAYVPELRTLSLPMRVDITDEQVEQLRSLTQVTTLDVNPFPAGLLARLLAPGHQLGWTSLPPSCILNDTTAPLLAGLPHLSSLLFDAHVSGLLSRLDFLASLPQLTLLDMSLYDVSTEMASSLLVLPLHFPTLRSFALSCCSFTSEQLGTLLSRMPRLHTLVLESMPQLESLSFLRTEPLRSTLRSLLLRYCSHPALLSSELTHLHGLQLTSLTFDNSLSAAIDHSRLAALTPPSLLLPQLQEFDYTPLEPDEEEDEDADEDEDEDEDEGCEDEEE